MMKFLKKSGQKLKQYWMLIPMLRFLLFFYRKDAKDVAVIYATLIIRGYKTFAQVPVTLQDRVRQVLIELDMGHLAE